MKRLTGKQIARMLTLGLISAYLLYAVCFYAREIYLYTPQMEYVDSMQVDGAEMAPITNFFVAGTNGMIEFLMLFCSVVAIVVIGLLLLIPWRCIAIRKKSQVTETEWKYTKSLFCVFCAGGLIVGFILLHFSNLLSLLILTAVAAAFIAVFSVWPVHSAYKRCMLEREEEKKKTYRKDDYIPIVKASICNGEQVAGFKDKRTGHFDEIMLIQSEKDLQEFKEQYGLESIKKEY